MHTCRLSIVYGNHVRFRRVLKRSRIRLPKEVAYFSTKAYRRFAAQNIADQASHTYNFEHTVHALHSPQPCEGSGVEAIAVKSQSW